MLHVMSLGTGSGPLPQLWGDYLMEGAAHNNPTHADVADAVRSEWPMHVGVKITS